MKPSLSKLLFFPALMISAGILCSYVLLKFSKNEPPRVHKTVVRLTPKQSLKQTVKEIVQPAKTKPSPTLKKNIRVVSKKKRPLRTRKAWFFADLARVDRVRTIIVDEVSEEIFNETAAAAIDLSSPLEEIMGKELAGNSPSVSYNPDPRISMVALDESTLSGGFNPVPRMAVVEGLFAKNSLDDLHVNLEVLKSEDLPLVQAPVETVVASKQPGGPVLELTSNTHPALEEIPQQNENEEKSEINRVESISPPPIAAHPVPQVAMPKTAMKEQVPLADNPNIHPREMTTQTVVEQDPTIVLNTLPGKKTTGVVKTVSSDPKPNPQPHVPTPKPHPEPAPETENGREGSHYGDSGTFYGKLLIDRGLRTWLVKNNAHFELYLHRENGRGENSKDPQDTQFIEYEFGTDEFEFEGENLQGRFRLIAAFYSGNGATSVGQIQYPKSITAGDYKKHILFDLKHKDLEKSMNTELQRAGREPGVMNITVFRGVAGNYRQATPVSGATFRVVGHNDWGSFKSDPEGNVRIPKISGRSEYILDVSAEGYFPTRQTVPVFDSDAYGAVYLIAKEDVYSVTHYFTQHDQEAGKSVVMGRVFDSKTRLPQQEEEIFLSFRKGRAVYFNSLPDLSLRATTESGMFGFFNVEPSIRSLSRASGKHSSLVNLLPDYGVFYEFGRGGQKALKGRVFDPFRNSGVSSKVHLVGDENHSEVSSEDGYFTFPAIDLPPGVLTVEVRSEGFPTTWHTVPWNAREPERMKNLFMLDREVVEESIKINRVKVERTAGMVIGGAENSFFKRGRSCVRVSLEDPQGRRMPSEKGPFPIAGAKVPTKGFCLTQNAPGFAFFNVPSGEYILKWLDKNALPFRSRVVRVGVDRVSVVVN